MHQKHKKKLQDKHYQETLLNVKLQDLVMQETLYKCSINAGGEI